ncbi:MAG: methyltransferase domain-containing protein [Halobacteriales archaeon]
MATVEEEVLDAARYLREVRPLDPAELRAYVESRPTSDEVRAILRSHAWELRLVETPDGTFEPVRSPPVTTPPSPPERLPTGLTEVILEWLREAFGPDWATGRSGERLRSRVRALKAAYLRAGTTHYEDESDAAAYLLYHLPRSYAATATVLGEVIAGAGLPRTLRVLDVGAGVGAHLAAITDVLPDDALVRYEAVEPTPSAAVLDHLAGAYRGRNVHVHLQDRPIEAVDLDGRYDLVLLGNVLSELEVPTAVAGRTFEAVASDGTWVAIAPADPRTSTQLYDVARSLEPPATVYAPDLRLWEGRRPTDEHWAFIEGPRLEVPPFQRRLGAAVPADERGAFRNVAVRFSYAVLRRDGVRRFDVRGDPRRHVPLATAAEAVGSRVNLLAVKLTRDLADGENALFRLGDGSQSAPWFASLVRPTPTNRALLEAPHGAVLAFERALVLWNADEGAYNAVVDDDVRVTRVAP